MDKTIYVPHTISVASTEEAVYTCPAGKTFIGKVSLFNTDGTADVTFETYITVIIANMYIGKGITTLDMQTAIKTDYVTYERIVIPSSATLKVKSSSTNALVTLTGIEVDANIGVLASLTPATTGTAVDVYTVASGKVFTGKVAAYHTNAATNQVRSFAKDAVPNYYVYGYARQTLPGTTALEMGYTQGLRQMLNEGYTWSARNELANTQFVIMGIKVDNAT